jgi:O-antigen/teichoic acid export membrane protein
MLARRALHNARHLVGGRVCAQATRAMYVLVLARSLDAAAYGSLAFAQASYLVLLPFVALGTREVVAAAMGRSRAEGERAAAQALGLRAISLIVCGVLLTLVAAAQDDPGRRQLLLVALFALAGRATATWAEHVMVACERSELVLRQEITFRPIEVAVALGVLLTGGNALGLMMVHGIVWLAQGIAGLWLVGSRLFPVEVSLAWQDAARMLRSGAGAFAASSASIWILSGPLLLFEAFGGTPERMGQLALALQVLRLVSAWPALIGQATLPVLSDSRRATTGEHARFLESLLQWASTAGGAIALAGAGLSPIVVPMVFGPRFAPAGSLLGLAMLAIPLAAVATTLSQAALARRRFGLAAGAAACGLAAWLVASFAALAGYGEAALLWAVLTGLAVWTTVLAAILLPQWGVRARPAVVAPLVVIGIGWAGYTALEPLHMGAAWAALAAAAAVLAGRLARASGIDLRPSPSPGA